MFGALGPQLGSTEISLSNDQLQAGFGVVVSTGTYKVVQFAGTEWVEVSTVGEAADLSPYFTSEKGQIWMTEGTVGDLIRVVAALREKNYPSFPVIWHPLPSPVREAEEGGTDEE